MAFRIEIADLRAGRDVETCFDDAVIAERNAQPRICAEQTAFANRNALRSTARQSSHDGCATADVGPITDHNALRDAPLNHRCAECSGVEVHEALVHHNGARREVGAKSNARCIRDAHAFRRDVIGQSRKAVDTLRLNAGAQQCRPQLIKISRVHGPRVRPHHVLELPEDALEIDGVGGNEQVREQVQPEVCVGCPNWRARQINLDRDRGDSDSAAGIRPDEISQVSGDCPFGLCARTRTECGCRKPRVENRAVGGECRQAVAPCGVVCGRAHGHKVTRP